MARFIGVIGFSQATESSPGVWEDVISERTYSGNVVRNTVKQQPGDKVINDISVGNSISIVADKFANEHLFAIRYVRWLGTRWTISDVEVSSPRLLLRLGGIYNGPAYVPPDPS